MFSSITLCEAPLGYYFFDKQATGKYMSVSVSICNSTSVLLACLSFVELGDGSHVCDNRVLFQR